ncbi:MAG: hypothetical protein ABIA66_03810 [Candidatus Omnitrophota bacterium]
MNIFIGNLAFASTQEDVKKLFSGFGVVSSVLILMDKKGRKSRGFGFAEMPDEQEAQAAIAALNDKEFMGRVLKVEEGRPRIVTAGDADKREKVRPRFEAKKRSYDSDNKSERQERSPFSSYFVRTGRYKGGRRTGSFIRKRLEAGIENPVLPERRFKENPLRWRKKKQTAKPWQKRGGEFKPGQKTGVESKPLRKSGVEPKPWQKREGEFKPRQKTTGTESKPWRKSGGGPKPWEKDASRRKQFHSKGRKKSGGYKKRSSKTRI